MCAPVLNRMTYFKAMRAAGPRADNIICCGIGALHSRYYLVGFSGSVISGRPHVCDGGSWQMCLQASVCMHSLARTRVHMAWLGSDPGAHSMAGLKPRCLLVDELIVYLGPYVLVMHVYCDISSCIL